MVVGTPYFIAFALIIHYSNGYDISSLGRESAEPAQLEILGDRQQFRSHTEVDDVIAAILLALRDPERRHVRYTVYNIGNRDFLSVKGPAGIIIQTISTKNARISHDSVLNGIGWRR